MPSTLTATEIANLALTKLGPGSGFLTDLDTDTSTVAQACRRTYVAVRDLVLEAHPWRFARKRTNLSAAVATPSWGFDHQYELPSDCLRVLSVEGSVIYEQEDGLLLCNEDGPLYVRYLARVTDTSKFSPTFVQALASRWAAELAVPVTKSHSRRTELLEEFLRVDLTQARKSEGFGAVPEKASDGDWLDARD